MNNGHNTILRQLGTDEDIDSNNNTVLLKDKDMEKLLLNF